MKLLIYLYIKLLFLHLFFWQDDLIWCPSQCTLKFKYKRIKYCIYLRWRWDNPWTATIIKYEDFIAEKESEWRNLYIDFYRDSDNLNKIKLDAILKTVQHLEEL